MPRGLPVPMRMVGVRDRYGWSGPLEALVNNTRWNGLTETNAARKPDAPALRVDRGLGRHLFTFTRAARCQFYHAIRKPAGPHRDTPRQADQVHRGELGPCPFFAVVVEGQIGRAHV